MQVLPEYAKYYVAILVDTGLRTGELERIRWRDVDTINNRLPTCVSHGRHQTI